MSSPNGCLGHGNLNCAWDLPKNNWSSSGGLATELRSARNEFIHTYRSYRKREPLVDSFLSPTEGEGD